MKRKLFLIVAVLAMVLGFSAQAFAQDKLPAVDLILWSQDQQLDELVQKLFDEQWAPEFAPGSTLTIVNAETEEMRNQLLTAGLAGTGLPDFFVGPNDPIGVFVDAGIVQPLDELFDTTVYNGTLAAGQLDGTTFGIPVSSGNHLMMLYNKSLVETAPDTWADLFALSDELKAANADVEGFQPFAYNLNEPFWFLPFVGGFGGSVFNEDGTFALDSEAWVNAYQFVGDLKANGYVPQECDYACADSLFKEGKTAIILNGDWSLADYLDVEKSPALGPDNLGIAPWPALENGSRPTPYTSGKFVSIPITTEGDKLAAAIAFTTWLSTSDAAITAQIEELNRLPALSAAFEGEAVTGNELLNASAQALLTGVGMPPNVELRFMWDAVRPNLEGVMSGAVAPADAATEAQFAAEDAMANA
jgi:arabinogalactan oligomer / maltooligosaccharide transport system substrate-binding protein